MANTTSVDPVKQFVALLWGEPPALEQAMELISQRWGALDCVGSDHPFDVTDYYADEMGGQLQRRLVSFEQLVPPESLSDAKLLCNAMEVKLARDGRRTVNLDVGYLDHNKIVLGSVKYAGQKIHLGQGVYADLVARFRHGRYQPFEWTFPDFRDGRYEPHFATMRARYLEQLRGLRITGGSHDRPG